MSLTALSSSEPVNLEDLFRRCLGNLELVERVLLAFVSNFDKDLDELESAVEAGCFESVAQLAHRMKGAAANVAAMTLARELACIEQHSQDQQLDEASVCMARLRDEWQRFQAAEKNFAGNLCQ